MTKKLISLLVVVSTAAGIIVWRLHEGSRAPSLIAETSLAAAEQSNSLQPPLEGRKNTSLSQPSGGATSVLSSGSVLENQAVSSTARQADSSKGIMGESLEKLLGSNELKRVDYARLRLLTHCAGRNSNRKVGGQLLSLQIQNEKRATSIAPDAIKRADTQTRHAALAQLEEFCVKVFDGERFPKEVYATSEGSTETKRFKEIAKLVSAENIDESNPKTVMAMKTVLAEPMFGLLELNLYSHLSYRSLQHDYTAEQLAVIPNVVVPILLCRMGDDCGPNGFMNLQICVQHGVCGNYVENSIWDSLRNSPLNTAALRRFIDNTYLALQAQDTSIFKR